MYSIIQFFLLHESFNKLFLLLYMVIGRFASVPFANVLSRFAHETKRALHM